MSYRRQFNAAARRRDIYKVVTDRVIADLEKGVRPWTKPWDTAHIEGRIMRPLRHNGLPYSGINVLMLWTSAEEQGFSSPTWMTYRQAQELRGFVRKGQRGSPVVYASTFKKEIETDEGDEETREIPFLKTYTVFNVEQIDDLPDSYYAKPTEPLNPIEQIARAETFFDETGARIEHRGTQALYSLTNDHIRMPPMDTFRDAESYYATLAHETTHWTRHPTRLDRDFGRKRWGDEGYAREELVAELGAAYLCADLDLVPEVREDHAAYMASWIKVLQNDKRAIFSAAAHAQRAMDFLHEMQPGVPAPETNPARHRDPEPHRDDDEDEGSGDPTQTPDGSVNRPRGPQLGLFQ